MASGLVWFGEYAYPDNVRRFAQPSIKVVLSPLRCDPTDDAALAFPDSTERDYTYEDGALAQLEIV